MIAAWAPGEKRAPYIEKWQAFVDKEIKLAETAAPSMKGMKQTTNSWTSVAVERAFVTSAF